MSVRVIDRLPQFNANTKVVLNDALRSASADVLLAAKTRAPFKKGGLRRETDVKQVSFLHWRVTFWIEYARFQEFGGDKSRRVRNYSTPGTGAHYLERSGDDEAKKMEGVVRMHLGRIK